MSGFDLQRLGVVMEPAPDDPHEVGGVLNPAAARGPDGQLYLFPRLVAAGNYSRIGIARVLFDRAGEPTGVERMGIALEPEPDYELRGCEDPRITFVEPLGRYMMTYTAFSARGPRIALAQSDDLFHWQRLGLATFAPYEGVDFDGVDNKDAVVFPIAIPDPSGRPAMAILHRPLFPGTRPEEKVHRSAAEVDLDRESIWISYAHGAQPCHFASHHRLATPAAPWERLKIGGGAPPVMTRHGWLILYHGVGETEESRSGHRHLRYAAGAMVLANEHPRVVVYRSPTPILSPEMAEERLGVVSDVVFPTGIDRRDDLGTPDRFDIYYGMADLRIGVARLDVPRALPPAGRGPTRASSSTHG